MQSSQADAVPKALHVSSEDVEGVTVYDAVGKKIGNVDYLVIEKTTGKVLGVVVNVSGFIGLGHYHREFPWNALHYDPDLKGFRADLLQGKVT